MFSNSANRLVNIAYFVLNVTKTFFFDTKSREVSPVTSPTGRKISQGQRPGATRKTSDKAQGLHVSRKASRSRDVSPVTSSQSSRKEIGGRT